MSVDQVTPFKKILVANRGEIAIRVFRACTELGIATVAIYSHEDRLHLHRYKADEAYLVGRGKSPLAAYLEYDEIIELALEKEVDAIHPGYGFLSENSDFARACEAAGIVFIGPSPEVLDALGDKVKARHAAEQAGLPTIPGTPDAVDNDEEALAFASEAGYPLMVKAAMGGGGRGMAVVNDDRELVDAMVRCRAEAQSAFGDATIFLERYLQKPRHIEVQVLGDQYGNLVHLFERDCSVQRRHQKVVEIAPAMNLTDKQRQAIYRDALAICRQVNYSNAGTVEFLFDGEGRHYFIEVNPRIQVEHTITEVITGRDLVQAQIRVAEGYPLHDDTIRIADQAAIKKSGYCLQQRLTTEDAANGFAPDSGQITAFRAAEGFGIRLDVGAGFDGSVISPYYDSLLIKVCSWALDYDQALAKGLRAIREFRIRGVKTNIPFLENLLEHPVFQAGECDTTFIDNHPELLEFKPRQDRANKLLSYFSELALNGFPGIDEAAIPAKIRPQIESPVIPVAGPSAAFEVLQSAGAQGVARWLLEQEQLLVTDTTFRDAHQSLLATRVRSRDILKIAPVSASIGQQLFSFEMWGGATFDVAYRFLHEDPWQRLARLREMMPGTLLQMLLRSGNAVGYTNYPDNVVNRFIDEAAAAGIDVFRIFDCLNWVEGLRPCIERVVETGKIAEAAICYSGDITDGKRVKFTLDYYLSRAKQIEQAGAHILAIKDMAGLLKPEAARILVSALKDTLTIPVHLHTHDTSGNGVATLLAASAAGVDVVDAALSAMSGVTSQPSLNALVAAMQGTPRATGIDANGMQQLADYWEGVREIYAPFECGLKTGSADVYDHEIPGGQYSNFRPQAISMGLGERWDEVRKMYRTVNDMLGDIIKVTPSSKAVGDMALFMVQNDLTPDDVIEQGHDLAFPDSIVSLLSGMMGQPDGGFPEALQQAVCGDGEIITVRPGELLEPWDFAADAHDLGQTLGREPSPQEQVSAALYPKIFREYSLFQQRFGEVSVLDTAEFFYGLKIGEEKAIEIEPGKTLIVKLLAIGQLEADGQREIFFELNGRRRNQRVVDRNAVSEIEAHDRADLANSDQIGAPMPGVVVELHVAEGDEVREGEKLLTTEAMKMLNVIVAPRDGKVMRLPLGVGVEIAAGDLICELG
ncbi:MAG: pyruvate carboxylase [Gammaproteobacteria bacterium]|nr:MAG: pyruvate carboxylase [Gammaproteobacteria bacterium]